MGSNPIESTKFNIMITYDEFVQDVWNLVKDCPKNWRKGQSVFNVVDENYNVARIVQFVDHIDCFYNDNMIDKFLQKAYERVIELQE